MNQPASLAIFCKVVDNYGDIGICWRLARQIRHEHAVDVTLWVDDLRTFRRICPGVRLDADLQQVEGVTVRHWTGQVGDYTPADIADIVIEFFGCDIPPGYVEAMAKRDPRPVWINYEGLSAEEWVEGCHTLPSMHPRLPLTKYFFFPGFTAKTGGLLREAALLAGRDAFQSDRAAMHGFLSQLGVAREEMDALKVSLFCYPHAPVAQLFDAWAQGQDAVTCLVPEGVAVDTVHAFLGQAAKPGVVATRGKLTVRVLPFVAQPDYDRLLWACDLNFVRGEDSFVRAQWAGRPFIWHIYPQDENLHHKKLRAFLARYASAGDNLPAMSLAWNGAASADDMAALWRALRADLPALHARAASWEREMLAHGDAVSNLLTFAMSRR